MSVITISRQFGAGGRTLGNKLFKKLGYQYVDEDIVEQAAQEANVSPEGILEFENKTRINILNYLKNLKPFGKSLIERPVTDKTGHIDGYKYVEILHKVIPKIAAQDNVIIVGRGGQYILQDFEGAFHVLLIAEKEDRIRFIEKKYNLSASEAGRWIKNMEKRRINLYRYFNRKDYDDMILYNLTLNMSLVDMDKAVDIIAGMLGH